MTVFTRGTPLDWADIVPLLPFIKKHALAQFLALFAEFRERQFESFVWGDELEYSLVQFEQEDGNGQGKVQVSLGNEELLGRLKERMGEQWVSECTKWMLESRPARPFTGQQLDCFLRAEEDMRQRRLLAHSLLHPGQALLTAGFPACATPDFVSPSSPPNSLLLSELIYTGPPVFNNNLSILRCMDARRGSKITVQVPVFKDQLTEDPFTDPDAPEGECEPGNLYSDTCVFGWTLCALQLTVQGRDQLEARWIHDQLVPLCPLTIALTAANPILKGLLVDFDSRLPAIEQTADDRTPEERADGQQFSHGRSCPVECFMHPDSAQFDDSSTSDKGFSAEVFRQLMDGGLDRQFAHSMSRLFVRDPLLVFKETLDPPGEMAQFNSLLNAMFPYVRFKVPLDDGSAGWRVEFRPMDVQLTDFENAALCCFVLLCLRTLLSFRLSLLVPLSVARADVNRSFRRDAILAEKFHFRLNPCTEQTPPEIVRLCEKRLTKITKGRLEPNAAVEMDVNEIVNGNGPNGFVGLLPLIRHFLDNNLPEGPTAQEARARVDQYLELVQGRANGSICTLAKWMRNFVAEHPDYGKDSRVEGKVLFQLLKKMEDISSGRTKCPELLGPFA